MIVEFDKSFNKSIIRLKDKSIAQKLEKLIETLESVDSISKAPNVKKLSGFQAYYRIRIGDLLLNMRLFQKLFVVHIFQECNKIVFEI